MLMQQWWLYRMIIDLHKELAVKCLQAGQKHALLKKPVCTNAHLSCADITTGYHINTTDRGELDILMSQK